MKLKNIKTEGGFFKCADNWYKRAHRLREVWQNPNESKIKQAKAFRLWLIMYSRVMKMGKIAMDIRTKKYKNHGFKNGRYTY